MQIRCRVTQFHLATSRLQLIAAVGLLSFILFMSDEILALALLCFVSPINDCGLGEN